MSKRPQENYRTQIGEPVAVTGIERCGVDKAYGACQNHTHLARYRGYSRVHRSMEAVTSSVGIAQQPSRVFYGADASLFQMLRISATIAVPAIVSKYSRIPVHHWRQTAGPRQGKLTHNK